MTQAKPPSLTPPGSTNPASPSPNEEPLPWPDVRLIAPRKYRVQTAYPIEWQADDVPYQRIEVPVGFEFDGASIPAVLEWYLGRDKILPAALIHDFQYAYAGRLPSGSHLYLDESDGLWKLTSYVWSRKDCDRFFARNLRRCRDIRDDQRRNAYRAVRLFGWWAWRKAHKRMAKDEVSAPVLPER